MENYHIVILLAILGAFGGFSAWILSRIDKMKKELEEKIDKVDKENSDIKDNYLHRFEKVMTSIYDLGLSVEKGFSDLKLTIQKND